MSPFSILRQRSKTQHPSQQLLFKAKDPKLCRLNIRRIRFCSNSRVVVVMKMNPRYLETEEEEGDEMKHMTTKYVLPILAGTIMQHYINEHAFYAQSSNRPMMISRDRSSIRQVRALLGDHYFKRAYRMLFEKFESLVQLLEPHLPEKKGSGPNGKISAELEISATLRYFAGASMYDLMLSHGLSHTTLFCSVWRVVSAINNCSELKITFPADHTEQRQIAKKFQSKSGANFDNCVECIDGFLICTEKPMERELEVTKCGSVSFYCGRKNKFGYNMQGVCNADGKFTAVWILHPAASFDCISLIRSLSYKKISTPGFLAPGCVIFGDNAYVH